MQNHCTAISCGKIKSLATLRGSICPTQSRNLQNLEIALRILRICKLCSNLEIAHQAYALSRLCSTSVQSWDLAISVACTIEPRSSFEFPSCIKVRNMCKELLQLCHHHQHQACTQSPAPVTSGKFTNPFSSVWVWVQRDPRPVECPCSRLHQLGELSILFRYSAQVLSLHCSIPRFTNS